METTGTCEFFGMQSTRCLDEAQIVVDSDSILLTPLPQASSTIDLNNHAVTRQVQKLDIVHVLLECSNLT